MWCCAGVQWKECYERTAAAVLRHCPRQWDFDVSSLYSYMDAFLQRCRDLLEVRADNSRLVCLDLLHKLLLTMMSGTCDQHASLTNACFLALL